MIVDFWNSLQLSNLDERKLKLKQLMEGLELLMLVPDMNYQGQHRNLINSTLIKYRYDRLKELFLFLKDPSSGQNNKFRQWLFSNIDAFNTADVIGDEQYQKLL